MRTLFNITILSSLFLLSLSTCFGQVSFTAFGTPVTQNFDSFGTATVNITDNTTITGLYAFRASGNAVPNVATVNNGSSNSGSFFNYGTTAATDRALGSVGSNGTGTLNYGMRYVNNTGGTITSLAVTYTGEQWRDGGNATPQSLTVDYRQAATVTSLTTGAFTAVGGLTFTSLVNSPVGAALDGNSAANRTVLTQSIAVTIPPGEEIMLRWTDLNDAANDHGLSIDDLTVTPNGTLAAGVSLSGRVMNSSGEGLSRVSLLLTGGSLPSPRVVTTNSFGYYTFDDLSAGANYIVTVSSKKYAFSEPSRVVSVNDAVTGFDFVTAESGIDSNRKK